jgi:transposase
MDAKATVKVGPFSRGGKSRVPTQAADHDFQAEATVTPVGILLPASDELFLYGVTSKVTSDCLVDCLTHWWERMRTRCTQITTLVINLDNGPENHSRRTQFMHRLVGFAQQYAITVRLAYYPPYHSKYNAIERCWGILENHWNGALLDTIATVLAFAQQYAITVRLAYYPPYHSKYNAIERCWGILENHWNGALLDTIATVLAFAGTMTWKGVHPVVELITTTYQSGVRLTQEAMAAVEAQLQRAPVLGKWFVDIVPDSHPG